MTDIIALNGPEAALATAMRQSGVIEWLPFRGAKSVRHLYMTADVASHFGPRVDPVRGDPFVAPVQAFCDVFTSGGPQNVVRSARAGNREGFPDWKPLDGGEPRVWEIRFHLSGAEPPYLRIFGIFVAKDKVVLLKFAKKDRQGLASETAGQNRKIPHKQIMAGCQRKLGAVLGRFDLSKLMCFDDEPMSNMKICGDKR